MKRPQRQEIWVALYTEAYVIGIHYGFVQYIQKCGDVFKPLELAEDSFVKVFKFKCNSKLDIDDLFKENDSESQ